MTAELPDGVYLGLDTEPYFAQDALGSTDLISLFFQRWGWWWQSRHNPDRVEKKRKDLTYGSALHAILLESVQAYEARFAVEPDKKAYPGLIDSIDEIKLTLVQEGFDLGGMSSYKKPEWLREIRASLPHVPVWSNILAEFEIEAHGKEVVTAVEDRNLRTMREVATTVARSDNEHVRQLFDEVHPPLAEVSVFWHEGGIRRRGRLDRMFPAFDMDLKSLGNWSGKRLDWHIGEEIARRGYDIQRADYFDARTAAMAHIRAGRLFGGTAVQRSWLEGYPDMSRPVGDWVWLFYQKPDAATGRAPVIVPVMDMSWHGHAPSPLRAIGGAKKRAAIDFYINAMATFGTDQPWARVEDLHYTEEPFEPRINIPPWIGEVDPNHGQAFHQEEEP